MACGPPGVEDPPIEIREARPEEFDAVADPTVRAYAEYEPHMPPEFWGPYRDEQADVATRAEEGTVLVVVARGRLVGSAAIYWDRFEEQTLHLKLVAVSPRRAGRASARPSWPTSSNGLAQPGLAGSSGTRCRS